MFKRYVTSARTGSNVEAAFLDLVERAVAFSDQQDKAAAAAGAAAGVSGWMRLCLRVGVEEFVCGGVAFCLG